MLPTRDWDLGECPPLTIRAPLARKLLDQFLSQALKKCNTDVTIWPTKISENIEPDVVARACNSNSWEGDTGVLLSLSLSQVPGQFQLQNENLSSNQKENNLWKL